MRRVFLQQVLHGPSRRKPVWQAQWRGITLNHAQMHKMDVRDGLFVAAVV